MPASAFSGVFETCVAAAVSNAFHRLSSAQLGMMPHEAVAAFTAARLATLPADACTGFTYMQLTDLGHSNSHPYHDALFSLQPPASLPPAG